MNEYDVIQQLNTAIQDIMPELGLEVSHFHSGIAQLEIKHLCGRYYSSLVRIKYLEKLIKTMSDEELVKTLKKMTLSQECLLDKE